MDKVILFMLGVIACVFGILFVYCLIAVSAKADYLLYDDEEELEDEDTYDEGFEE